MQDVLPLAYAALDKKYNGQERKDAHVSDLCICPRESVFRRLNPSSVGNMQLGFFTTGEGVHRAFQELMCKAYPDRYEGYPYEKSVSFSGISGHIDLYDKIDNIPIELKTINSGVVDQPKTHHTAQLKMYMAMLDAPLGKVIYQFFEWYKGKSSLTGPWREWTITLTDEQRQEIKFQMLRDNSTFLEAVIRKDPKYARHIWDDPNLNWKCKKYCDFKSRCEEMNGRSA